MHTAHGRALAVATGAKLADPALKVIVVMGDGDCAAIGGNHLIHAARRNVDLTALVFNNDIYGMTGGQAGPTTHEGDLSKTSPFGNPEPAFDICELARAAGATFVARGTPYAYLEAGAAHRRRPHAQGLLARRGHVRRVPPITGASTAVPYRPTCSSCSRSRPCPSRSTRPARR